MYKQKKKRTRRDKIVKRVNSVLPEVLVHFCKLNCNLSMLAS